MLSITISGEDELFDDESNTFISVDEVSLELEHSLVSLSKWESKHGKPFLSTGDKTSEEIFDYLKAMILTPDVDPDILYRCSQEHLDQIQEYIDSTQSATTFSEFGKRGGPGEVITSELIYFWMINYNIPVEFQYWHLNRLLTLVRICNIKNSKPKKASRHEIAQRNRELNERRRAQLNTSG